MTQSLCPPPASSLDLSERVRAIHQDILAASPAVCAERAALVTRYFRERWNDPRPMIIKKAEALACVLRSKQAKIYPSELLVGCFSSHRVGGSIYPELHGVAMMEDLFRFDRRPVNRLSISKEERSTLLKEVLPFWLTRFLALRAQPLRKALKFITRQWSPTFYLINETGGVSHFVPNYNGLLMKGTEGYRQEAAQRLQEAPQDSLAAQFLQAILIVCDGLEAFAGNYRNEALRQSEMEEGKRREELEKIALICSRVPRLPAATLQEALQSILFAQIALNLESLDNAVSPGRLDQILWPFYLRDFAAGRIDQAEALDLLGCFALKLCEIIPVFSQRITRFHGGLFNGQVVVVGGTDCDGQDATNELTYLFLEVMDRLRTRQPNYHARIHKGSPSAYRSRIASALAAGAASPAVYNDDVIIPVMVRRGISQEDARNYATVGCVEPVAAGKSFFSTDAALLNLPLCLELALNSGRRFDRRRRIGVACRSAEECKSMDDLVELFSAQLSHSVDRLLSDLRMIELANARLHPTPLTSLLLEGCMENARDATAGGASYNGSGIQGVGVVEVADSLAAIETVVFEERPAGMRELVQACRTNFRNHPALRSRLLNAPKYGNDYLRADRWVDRVMEMFASCLEGKMNSRGGLYTAGFYSVTAHQAFGEIVGALPSGRGAGAPFSSGISPGNGLDCKGPTAAILSAASLRFRVAPNGVNFNLKLAPWVVAGREGASRLQALIEGGFAAGCMQMQFNVLDPKILMEARDYPGRYPGLLVRVSGYSAYFDDLSPEMKQEIIDRTLCQDGIATL